MSHDVIYFSSEKCFSDGGLVCPMDPSEPSESIFVHRSQIVSIRHICVLCLVILKVHLHFLMGNNEFIIIVIKISYL